MKNLFDSLYRRLFYNHDQKKDSLLTIANDLALSINSMNTLGAL